MLAERALHTFCMGLGDPSVFSPFWTPNFLYGGFRGLYRVLDTELAMHTVWMHFLTSVTL
jgi:hypothetical protein